MPTNNKEKISRNGSCRLQCLKNKVQQHPSKKEVGKMTGSKNIAGITGKNQKNSASFIPFSMIET